MVNRLLHLFAVLSFVLTHLGCLAANQGEKVATEILTKLQVGTSLTDTEQRLKTKLRHEFTTRFGTNHYRCMHLLCIEPPASFYLLFENSNLVRIVNPPPFVWTNKPWQRPLPVDPDARIEQTMKQPALSEKEIAVQLNKDAKRKGNASDSMNTLPAFIITAPMWITLAPKVKAETRQVAQWHVQYDPSRAELGATVNAVRAAYGPPAASINASEGTRTELFGRRNPPNVPADMPNAFVAVVFQRENVMAVFSDHFFSTAWHPLMP